MAERARGLAATSASEGRRRPSARRRMGCAGAKGARRSTSSRLSRAIAQAKSNCSSISCQTLEKLLKNESHWAHNDDRDRPVSRNDNENLRGADLYLH
jgi:hypothetical protein